jgi:hypothetical protein
MSHENTGNDSLDQRLDALLAARPVAPRAGFADSIFRAIESEQQHPVALADESGPLDALVDARLRHHPLQTRPERTEKFFAGVIHAVRVRNILRWTVPALAASVALLLALPALLRPDVAMPAPEDVLAEAMAGDPALADMLRGTVATTNADYPVFDREILDAVSGLNDNTLAWLETLTSDEIN